MAGGTLRHLRPCESENMVDIQLINFVLHNFLSARVACTTILHCWDVETQKALYNKGCQRNMYTQYINIDRLEATAVALQLRHTRPTVGVFLDWNCGGSVDVLSASSRLRRFGYRYHWLIYDSGANVEELQRLFGGFNLSVDADVHYAVGGDAGHYTLYDVYSNGWLLGGQLNMTIDREIVCDADDCRLERYLSALHLRSKYGNRERLPDVTMRVSTVATKRPLSVGVAKLEEFLMSINDGHIDSIARFGYQMLMMLRDALGCNFTQTFYDHWSKTEVSGGSIGSLIEESTDFLSTPILYTAARMLYLSAITETGGFRQLCLFRTPRTSAIHGSGFFRPFSAIVWLLFVVVLLAFAVLLWTTFAVERRRLQRQSDGGGTPSMLATCLISFGSACIQSSHLVPDCTGGRIAFFTMLLVSFIMYNYYTSIVVSMLLGSQPKSSIRTLAQLAESPLEVGFEPLPYTMVYLNVSQLPVVRRLVQRKIDAKRRPASVWIPDHEGIKRVRDEPGFVYVFEASTGYALVEKYYEPYQICDLNEVLLRPERGLHTHLHRNSTYKEITRLKLLRMLETGVYLKLRRQWVRDHLNCFANNVVLAVGMEYTAPLFLMLLVAYGLVLLVLLLELAHKRWTDKRIHMICRS